MKTPSFLRRSLPLVLLACAGAGGLALASSPAPSANDALAEAMGQMNKALKTIGKNGLSDETRAAALAELEGFQTAVIAAKNQVPDTAAAVDEKKRDAFVADFRAHLCELLKASCDVEIAIVNGDYKAAEGMLKSELGKLKSDGHDQFKGD